MRLGRPAGRRLVSPLRLAFFVLYHVVLFLVSPSRLAIPSRPCVSPSRLAFASRLVSCRRAVSFVSGRGAERSLRGVLFVILLYRHRPCVVPPRPSRLAMREAGRLQPSRCLVSLLFRSVVLMCHRFQPSRLVVSMGGAVLRFLSHVVGHPVSSRFLTRFAHFRSPSLISVRHRERGRLVAWSMWRN